ncbi:MAG: PAS domain-containing protein [Promethearchaeota archaeon]
MNCQYYLIQCEKESVIQIICQDITEYKINKNKLNDILLNLLTYCTLIEIMNEGFVVQNKKGIITFINQKLCDIIRYKKYELIGKYWIVFIDEKKRSKSWEQLSKRKQGETSIYEIEILKKNREKIFVYILGTPLLDAEKNYNSSLVIVADISDRKKREEIKYRLAIIFESSNDAIISKNSENIIISWNNGAERICGYSSEEILDKSISILIPPEFPDDISQIFKKINKSKQIKHFETVYRRKVGNRLHVSLTISPIKDLNGKIIGASTITHDITERKRAEEELRLRSEIMMNIAEEVCFIRSQNEIIAYGNFRFEDLFGYNPREMKGKQISIVNVLTKMTHRGIVDYIMRIIKKLEHGKVRFKTSEKMVPVFSVTQVPLYLNTLNMVKS